MIGSKKEGREKDDSHLSGFGLCAIETFKPRQVRKEATVEGASMCHGTTRSLANNIRALN